MPNVGIRSRGNGSRSGFKPGLRVDIDRYSSTQKFLGMKSFVLRNNTQDPSQLHEWLSMLFFRRMGLPASREAFARLFVNNQYAGLYTIVESVDKSFLTRQFGEDEGYLFDYDYPAGRGAVLLRRPRTRSGEPTCRCRSSPRRTRTTLAPKSSPTW